MTSKKSMNFKNVILLMTFLILSTQAFGQKLAFPGAQGFGRFTKGGRGGSVYHVSNLNDSGQGSLRDAVSQSGRTVVFDIGGVIRIKKRIVVKSNVTIAGQTAPGGGITIYGNGVAFNNDSGNNIIRFIRIRMGKFGDSKKDAVAISAKSNYIFDHVSVTWGRDGTFDINGSQIDNVTIQNCIIGQGINISNHSTGALIQAGKVSVLRTLWIDNKTRNPKMRGNTEFINNVVYNWSSNGYILGATQGRSNANIIGNYFISGPSTKGNCFTRGTKSFHTYAKDNYWDKNKNGKLDGSLVASSGYGPVTFKSSPYNYHGSKSPMNARQAYHNVVSKAGASKVRDAVDKFLISELTSLGKKGRIINTEMDNGIPGQVGSVAKGSAPKDSDRDGMPDSWEKKNGMNPNSADNNGDKDGDGYTNLEEYINERAGRR